MGATLPLLGIPDVQEGVLKSFLGRHTRRPQVLVRARKRIQPPRLRPHRPLRLASSRVPATYNSHAVAAASAAPKSKYALSRMPKDKVQDLARSMGLDDSGRKTDVVERVFDAYSQVENGNGKATSPAASAADVADAKADQTSAATKLPVIGGYNLPDDSANAGSHEEQGVSAGEKSTAGMPTFDDLFAMPRAELVQQCKAVGLPHSKKNKEELAAGLLAIMQSGVATPSSPPQPGSHHPITPPDNNSEKGPDTPLQDKGKPGSKEPPQPQLHASPGFFSQHPTSAEPSSQGGTPDQAADSSRRRVKRASLGAQNQPETAAEPEEGAVSEPKAGVKPATATVLEAHGGGQDEDEGHKADMFTDASWLKPTSEGQREATILALSSMRKAELQQRCEEAGIQQNQRQSKQHLLQKLADFLEVQQQRPQQMPVDRQASEDALGGTAGDRTAALAEEERALDTLTKSQLQQRCQEADVPYAKRWGRGQLLEGLKMKLLQQRQEAQLPTEEPRELAGTRSVAQNASSEDVARTQGTNQYEVADADGSVKDVGIPGSEGAGQGRRPRRRRVAPLARDMDDVGPAAEMGVYLPELDPTAPDTAVADNAMDTDTDVVAQQRRTDKQPADLANQEGEEEDVQKLAMDDVLMLDQEPEPGFDLDDAQRPRLSRDAEGDLTEANFGNDDETMARLEDMGTSGADLVGSDMQRQGQGGAQRRRQASRTAFVPEDEDDEFGSRLTEARFPGTAAEGVVDGDSTDGEEEAEADYRDAADNARPGVQGRYQAAEDGDFDDLEDGNFVDDDDFADGFKVSNVASDSLALDEDDDDALMDGAAMTNQQFGRARQGTRASLEAAGVRNSSAAAADIVEDEEDEEQQQPTQAQLRPKLNPTPPLPPTPPVTTPIVPTPDTRRQPTAAATAPAGDPVSSRASEEPASDSGVVTQAQSGAKTGFPVPDWLASRQAGANGSAGASRPAGALAGQPSVQMTAMSFKPKKRQKDAGEPDLEPAAGARTSSSTAGAASADKSSPLDAEPDGDPIPPMPLEELAAAASLADSSSGLEAQSSPAESAAAPKPAADPAVLSPQTQSVASNGATSADIVKAAKAATGAVLELTDLASDAADDAEKAPDRQTAVEKALEAASLADMASDQFKTAANAAAATLGTAKADEAQALAQAAGTEAGAAARKAAETAVDLQSEEARSAALQVTQDFLLTANEAQQLGMKTWEADSLADVHTALSKAALEQRSKGQSTSGSPSEDPGAQIHKAMDAGPGADAAAAYEAVQDASAKTIELADLTEIAVGDAERAEDQDEAAAAAKRAASSARALTEEYATAVAAAVEANADGKFPAAVDMAQVAGGEAAAFTRAAAEAAAAADTQEAISAALTASEALKLVAAAATDAGMAADLKDVEEAHEELSAMQQQSESSPSTESAAQSDGTPAGAVPPEDVNLEPSLTPESYDTAHPAASGPSESGSPANAPAPAGAEALAADAPAPLGAEALAQVPSPSDQGLEAGQIDAASVERDASISAEAQNVIDAGVDRALSGSPAASPASGAPDKTSQGKVVVQADLSAQLPSGRSEAALSDELGHNDIAGADAHRWTDAELSSQTFSDAVQGASPSTSAPPPGPQADCSAEAKSAAAPAHPAHKPDTTAPSSPTTQGSAEQALPMRSNASGGSKLTDAEVEDLVAAEPADYPLASSQQSSQTNELLSSGVNSNSGLTDAEVEGLVAAEQADYPVTSSLQSSQTNELLSSGVSSDSGLTDAEVEDLTAAEEAAPTAPVGSLTPPQPTASSPSQASSASPTATLASPTGTQASPISTPASPAPLASSSASAPASSLATSASTSESQAERPAQDPAVPAAPTASSLGLPQQAVSAPPPALQQELEADLAGLQALRAQVADKQAALASMEAQLGSTNASSAGNRSQIQKLQLQMTELQDQHMAWQQNMLDGRLQELRTAAARVENNQSLKAELQQQVEGMSSQLNSLEASLKASDKQIGNLQQELASLGKSGPKPAAAVQVNGRHPANLPKGAFFEAADLTPEEEHEQQQAASRSQADEVSKAKAQLEQSQVRSTASDDKQEAASSPPDADPKSTAIQPGVAVTFGLMRVAEAGQATANFFSGLWGKKPKSPN